MTFLFTDIERSTRLLQELGDDYAGVLAEHRSSLRDAFARHDGVEVDTQGDAFFVPFGRAKDALAAAVEARDALDRGPVGVRMGLHTGEPLLTEHGYVGIPARTRARQRAAGSAPSAVALENEPGSGSGSTTAIGRSSWRSKYERSLSSSVR